MHWSNIKYNICKRHALVKYELIADVPCPALTGEPWDVYFELQGYKLPRYIGIWLYYDLIPWSQLGQNTQLVHKDEWCTLLLTAIRG